MISLNLKNHLFSYELCDVIRLFYGKDEIKLINDDIISDLDEDFLLTSEIEKHEGKAICKSCLFINEERIEQIEKLENQNISDKLLKRLVKISMYKLLSKINNKTFPWGILSGIRPVKLVHELLDKGTNHEKIIDVLENTYLMYEDRARLALQIALIEQKHIYPINKKKVSVYIGIPFCPSKCYYCSFTSNSIVSAKNNVSKYIDSLIKEISEVATFLNKKNIEVQCAYLGGGTPTSLDEANLKRVIDCILANFGETIIEFTCEAGRPDTINKEKLMILKNGKVTRLSINPQTMNDETLQQIGRMHNSQQILDSYKLAKECGFIDINMDIILGLQNETMEDIRDTLEKIKVLSPTNITVHTLSIKRASALCEAKEYDNIIGDDTAEKMMDITKEYMRNMNMIPYYLYRQKFMKNNLENIGFCKEGYECIYNIQMIEDKQTIIGFGAYAVTKTVYCEENRMERYHNIKDYILYINQIDNIIEKKIKFLSELY